MNSFEQNKREEKTNREVSVDSSWIELAEGFPATSSKDVESKIEFAYETESAQDFDKAVDVVADDLTGRTQAIVDKANEVKIEAEAHGRSDLAGKMAVVASEASSLSSEAAKEIAGLVFSPRKKSAACRNKLMHWQKRLNH
jgi:hypothetical protein